MIETAYAKINLALHVRHRRGDGYHAIETLFAFAEDGDRLTLQDGDDHLALTVDGQFGAELSVGADNLVTRAAGAYRACFGGRTAAFGLDKSLPVAAGIGGGSADAAAVLRLLARRDGVAIDEPALIAIAVGLGADVPACLGSRAVRGDGRGDALRAVDAAGLAGTPLLLVNPNVPLATGPVFAGWDGRDRGALADGAPLAVAAAGRNDLESPARAIRPEIGAVLSALTACVGARLVRMSGSGATCFALFDTIAARDAAAAAMPGAWWTLVTRLRA